MGRSAHRWSWPASADLATAQANYDLSKTTADRYQSLLKSDSVARQDVEDRVGDLHAKKAMMDSASFNERRLEETQRFQKIYAPFDGVITARNTDIGALIDAGANSPGKELFDIEKIEIDRIAGRGYLICENCVGKNRELGNRRHRGRYLGGTVRGSCLDAGGLPKCSA